jgi:hypothetical protein
MRPLRRYGQASLLIVTLLLTGTGLVFMLVIFGAAAPAAADTQTALSFQAPAGEIPVETEITVTVRLSDVVDMYALALTVDYPPDLLEIVDSDPVKPGIQAAPANCPNPVLPLGIVVENLADNQLGRLSYVLTQLAPTPPVNGHCDVLHIHFRTIDGPTADLQFTSVRLADRDGTELLVTPIDKRLTLEEAGIDVYLPTILRFE